MKEKKQKYAKTEESWLKSTCKKVRVEVSGVKVRKPYNFMQKSKKFLKANGTSLKIRWLKFGANKSIKITLQSQAYKIYYFLRLSNFLIFLELNIVIFENIASSQTKHYDCYELKRLIILTCHSITNEEICH